MSNKAINFLRDNWILQPFLFSIYFVLANLVDFGTAHTKLTEVIWILLAVALYWVILFFVFRIVFKDNFKNSYLASYLVFTSIQFKYICNGLMVFSGVMQRHIVLAIALVFVLLFTLSIRDKKALRPPRKKIILFLNILLLLITLQLLGKTILLNLKRPATLGIQMPLKVNAHFPDIYLIVLDGYANEKSLKKYWGYDDSAFIQQLVKWGFYYAPNTKSNYAATVQTIGSMLNLDYLAKDDLKKTVCLLQKIKYNPTVGMLQQCGYHVVDFSVFDIDNEVNTFKDSDDFADVGNFLLFSFSKSIFYYVERKALVNQGHQDHFAKIIQREQNILDTLPLLISTKSKSPKFVYYHSMLTHPPYYLDKNGNPSDAVKKQNLNFLANDWFANSRGYRSLGNIQKDSNWMAVYINALTYTNKKSLQLIKNILENNPTPPIVVVISDHGFRLLVDRPLHDIQSEKYSNFCAMYFPDKDYRNLYDSITPINVLRAVLNKAISTKFNRLPDLSGLSN